MKKIIALLMTVVVMVSCSSDVKFNSPSFQALKDNNTWKASKTEVKIADGYMYIKAFRGQEEVDLVFEAPTGAINSVNPQVSYFGKESVDKNNVNGYEHDPKYTATYKFTDSGITNTYTTTEDDGDGQIIISSYAPATSNSVGKFSGTFRFNAVYKGDLSNVPANINFQQGYMFDIPLQ